MRNVTDGSHEVRYLVVLVCLMVAGCDTLPETIPVSGSVYFNDQPLKFGTVTFQPVEGGQPARGQIQSDGSYRLSTFSEGDGAMLGNHRVRVMCTTAQDPSNPAEIRANDIMAGTLLIPRKYTQLGSSKLTAEVKAEGENKFDFRLTARR